MRKFFFYLGILLSFNLNAQQTLTVENVMSGELLRTDGVGMMKWMRDGASYYAIERNADKGGVEVIRYEAATGARSTLIDAEMLKGLSVNDFQWSDDGSKMLIYHDAQRVWRYPTRGAYDVLDLATGKRHALGKTLPAQSLMFAKFAPDGKHVAYVSKNNIFVEDLNGNIKQITNDGCEYIINGTFDWMYEEEFDCRDGFRWSGDGRQIAYWQSDTRGTGVFDMIDNVDSIYPRIIPLPYPKVGTTISAVRVGTVSIDGGETTWIDLPGKPRENYIPRMNYIPGSNELFIQQCNRLQNTYNVWLARDGRPTLLFVETDAAWVDPNDDVRWLDGNSRFLWMSERDGWRHLYSISRDGKQSVCLSPGNFDVINIAGIDVEKGYIYFHSTETNFTQRYLYRASLNAKRKAKVECMDKATESGHHSYNFSPSGKWALHSFHNSTTPPVYKMVSFPANVTARVMEDNSEAKETFASMKMPRKEFIRVDIGEVVLDAWLIKPRNFDPTKRYPIIFDVYGEPAGSTVQDSWGGGDFWHQYLAQEGFIVASIDNRGANVPRGREWRKSIYKNIGQRNIDDQAAATRKMLEMFAFIDPARVGITGWSGGGSTTLNCMFRYPDLYKAGIAVAFISDLHLYDAAYEERYMGLPEGPDDAYHRGSAVTHAHKLKGELLMMHGTGDDNVHYQNCELLINELVKNKKMFQVLPYPMRSHGIWEGRNTSLHVRLSMAKFWKDHL